MVDSLTTVSSTQRRDWYSGRHAWNLSSFKNVRNLPRFSEIASRTSSSSIPIISKLF